jgi:predicted acylesterase/phospholipase RssA
VSEQAAFEGQKPSCDIVMKGGITSGVVYPLAVVELAKKYRLQSIGGTSAGAIAAAVTAAAEYGRASGGYLRVAEIPQEIAFTLLAKFQPDPQLKPLFDILIAAIGGGNRFSKAARIVGVAIRGYPPEAIFGVAPGILTALVGGLAGRPSWILIGLLLIVMGGVIALTWRILRALTREVPGANYGLCSGLTVAGSRTPGLTDWLADTIDRVAGFPEQDGRFERPLTFGDLDATPTRHAIHLATMTTDLSMRRPYRLPFRDNLHFFSKAEFVRLFPARVLDHMVAHSAPLPPERNVTGDLHYFPDAANLPVVVAARMSLSFPGLVQAVPLYKSDFTLAQEADRIRPVRCWFSDGGLSSNFPIHFFDRLWPNTPTFAISLERFNEKRHGGIGAGPEKRVYMASAPQEGQLLPIQDITGLGNFIMTLFDAAKDWQDNLQSVLPGYRERVVRVALKDDEGGLNLTMSPDQVAELVAFGEEAGRLAASPAFDLDEHRWRRFLIAMAELEESLDLITASHDGGSGGSESFGAFLERYHFQGSYPPRSKAWKREILARADELVAIGNRWRNSPTIRSGKIPKPECAMRITPKE